MANNLDWLGQAVADRLPARHRQALHDPVHAGQGLRPAAPRARPVVHRVQLHDAPGARLRARSTASTGVELQMGGADQWGNITAGLELIRRTVGRRRRREPAHGIAYKLLLSPSGAKFGKSEGGESVWLDPARTSPYAFYQYWLNADDRDVGHVPALVHRCSSATRSRRSTRRSSPPRGARGAAAAGVRRHRAGARRGGRARGRAPGSRRRSPRTWRRCRSRTSWRCATQVPHVVVARELLADALATAIAAGRVPVEGRGAPRRWRTAAST